MPVLPSLSDSRSSGPLCTPPYRDCRRQRRAAPLTTMEWANSLAVEAARSCGEGQRSKVRGVGLREFDDDGCAYTRCAGEMQGALVTVENLLADRQTQPGAALALGAIKRLTCA